jgi:hypothetical protein
VKQTLPSKAKIVAAWSDAIGAQDPPWGIGPIDWGEPQCWGCHYYASKWPDGAFSAWNRAKGLQRCHIVPESLGGSNDPLNLVLLCHRCHEDSPDNSDPNVLFTWMRNQPKRFMGSWLPDQMSELQRLSQAAISMSLENELATAATEYSMSCSSHFGWMSDGTRAGLIGHLDKTIAELAAKETR